MDLLTQEEINNIHINVKRAKIILSIIAVVNFMSSFSDDNFMISAVFQIFFGYYLITGSNPMRWFFIICMSIGCLFMFGLMIVHSRIVPYTLIYGTLNFIFVLLLLFNNDVKNYCKYFKKQGK